MALQASQNTIQSTRCYQNTQKSDTQRYNVVGQDSRKKEKSRNQPFVGRTQFKIDLKIAIRKRKLTLRKHLKARCTSQSSFPLLKNMDWTAHL